MRVGAIPTASSGIPHELILNFMLCYARSIYDYHFIGADGYQADYQTSIMLFERLELKAMPLDLEDEDISGFSGDVRRVLAYARDNRLE